MIDSLYIGWRYVCFNKGRTATLVACVTLIAFIPVALQLLLNESQRQLLSRAVSTPLIVGTKGSALDLVMNTLYFDDEVPELMSMKASHEVMDSGLAVPIPMYVRFHAQEHPIVGTTFEYFDFRGLNIVEGQPLTMLGDCVVGAAVAEELDLEPNDDLISSPQSLFDLAGIYPLKMHVVGILERTHTSDDLAVFVDLKTAWVIEGLGHGHDDVTKIQDETLILERAEDNVTANAKLMHYAEITEVNIDSFHFHGDLGTYPITSVIAVPNDEKSGTILRGRYLTGESTEQIVVPEEVVDGLLENMFRIKNVLDAVIGLVGLATGLAILLVFSLSLRLRQREINTIFMLGCRRRTMVRLIAAEIFIILISSTLLCGMMLIFVDHYANDLVRSLFIRF